MFLLYFLLRWA